MNFQSQSEMLHKYWEKNVQAFQVNKANRSKIKHHILHLDIVEHWTHNSTGPFVLPCTVSTWPLGQNTEIYESRVVYVDYSL